MTSIKNIFSFKASILVVVLTQLIACAIKPGTTTYKHLRFDGLYVYDNGKDTIIKTSVAIFKQTDSLLKALGVPVQETKDSFCVMVGSTNLEYLRFYKDGTAEAYGTIKRDIKSANEFISNNHDFGIDNPKNELLLLKNGNSMIRRYNLSANKYDYYQDDNTVFKYAAMPSGEISFYKGHEQKNTTTFYSGRIYKGDSMILYLHGPFMPETLQEVEPVRSYKFVQINP